MNTRENMIIANERIITQDVRSCNYNRVRQKYDITFMSGKTYSYAYYNVTWLRSPQKLDTAMYRFSHDGRELFDVRDIYRFVDGYSDYWHIFFGNGSERDYRGSELQVVQSCLSDAEAKNVFEYLKRIADAVSLRTEDGGNLLARQYDKIDFSGTDTQGYKMSGRVRDLNNADILHTTRNGIKAYGVYDGDKFEVLDGSQINMDKPAALKKYNQQRTELFEKGVISIVDGKYILHATLEFNTPSGASDFVIGGSTNGWVEWKNSENKTLDEFFRKK